MSAVLAAVYAVHMLFAGVWAGSVVFVTTAVLPTAVDGGGQPDQLAFLTGRLRTISRTSAVLLFLTGGHLAATQYGAAGLTAGLRGYLVLAMVALWFALAGLVEVATGKLADGFAAEKIREPAREARPFLLAATAVVVVLLVDAGVIIGYW